MDLTDANRLFQENSFDDFPDAELEDERELGSPKISEEVQSTNIKVMFLLLLFL